MEASPVPYRISLRSSIAEGSVSALPTASAPFRTRALDQAHRHYKRIPSPIERSISLTNFFSPFLGWDITYMTQTWIPGFYQALFLSADVGHRLHRYCYFDMSPYAQMSPSTPCSAPYPPTRVVENVLHGMCDH